MKQFHFTIIFFAFTLFVNSQTSTEVGITNGQLSVSLSGAANYDVPILVPQGINGVEPILSLHYNSQGGNGIAGYGWGIAGVSGITRIASTKQHDGIIDPVDFDSLDRFALDGQRLIVKNGTDVYGANNTIYETENYSNIKVTSLGVNPNGSNFGPDSFKVEYPDGSIAYYGSSVNSRSLTTWSITTWENSKGVRINYQYTLANNDLNIASIKYGALSTGTPINEIQFSYVSRKRPEQSYVGGQSILQNNILSGIKVFTNGIGYRNYSLGYDETYKDYQRLINITEKSGDNSKSYNPTVFKYGDLVNSNVVNTAPSTLDLAGIDFQTMGNVSGDFDGDGKTDIILYPKTTADAKKKYWLYKNIGGSSLNIGFVDNTIGAFEEILPTSLLEGNTTTGLKLSTKQGWTVVKYDTATNVAKFSAYASSTLAPIGLQYEKTYTFPQLIYYSKHPLSCTQTRPNTRIVENISKMYLNGDFNGDGLTDIIAVEKEIQYTFLGPCNADNVPEEVNELYDGTVYFINMDKRLTGNYVFDAGSLSVDGNCKLYIADVNGDGKSDVIVIRSGIVRVHSLNANNVFVKVFEKLDSAIVTDKEILLGDYNGDGKADFVIPNAVDQDSWNFFMSTGTNFNKVNCAIGQAYKKSEVKKYYNEIINNNEWTTSLNENTFMAIDINGDGKTDILNQQNFTVEKDESGSPVTRPYKSPQMTRFIISFAKSFTGTAMTYISTLPFHFADNKINRYPIPIFANLNDASKSANYFLITGNSIYGLYAARVNKYDVLLNKITTGNGVTETISYQPLDTRSQQGPYSVYFNSGYVENYPNIDILNDPNFFVVSMLEKKSAASYKKKIFQYYGAVSNVEGLGFLGFRATMQTNWFDDASVSSLISNVSKFDITRRGANNENYSALGLYNPNSAIPSDLISRSVIEYNLPTDALQSNKVYKLKSSPVTEYDGQTSTSKEVNTVYDSNNNPLKITTSFKEGATEIQKNVVDIVYQGIPAGHYMVGRPQSKIVNSTLGTESMKSEEYYFYDNDDLLSKVQRKGDATTNLVTEDIEYNNFGNIIKKTFTAGSDIREMSFEYETTGRFLEKSTDIEGLATTFEYNTNGTLASKINPFLQKTLYEYDSWFKKTKETDYLNFVTTFSYVNNSGTTVHTKTGSDGSVEEETFDDLGRKTKTGVKNIMGSFSYISYLYDIHDRTSKVSEPYIGTTPSQWNETKYDAYGRLSQSITYTGKTTDVTYTGLKTTVSDGTKTEYYIKNALGKITSMYDIPSNTITYSYFPNGNLRETNYGGIITKIIQDGWGRKKQLIDPSAGTVTYSYNDFGELKSEVNGNGTTTYNLSSLGKLDTKTISGNKTNSKTTYTYDSASKLLVKSKFDDLANGTNTITIDYKYDASKRIIKKTETTPYAVFIKRFTYDTLGRLDFENSTAKIGTKLSSRTVRNTYKNGVPYQILDSITNNVIWQTNSVDSRGQLLTAQSGPTTITKNYDTNGDVKQFKFDKTTPLANILTLDQVFDTAKTNFISRSNNLFGWTESFDYDAKDRLTKFNNFLGTQETQSYDDKGRITQNNLGTYNYNYSGRPYQNSSIELTQETLGYYANREGIFNDSMEDKTGWGIEKFPNTNFYSYDAVKIGHAVGKNTLKLANTLTTEQYVYSDKWIDINNIGPTEYTYSAWVYSDNPQAQIFLVMKDAVGTLSYDNVVSNITGTWTKVTKTFLVPANVKKIRLRLDNNSQGNIWYDDVQIRKTSIPLATAKELEIFYNVFKSPEEIKEPGIERINFVYNDDNQRSTMFYGSLDDKLIRPLRKHYSSDGTMEIKENRTTNTFDFVTYIGGDGYSAPAIVKSDGNTQNYLYLQRDYQGSILAITDANGAVVEKRLFDAWGSIIKVQDGAGNPLNGLTVLDRGYTGHEHIQSVGIINMNGRLYDPKLHRFLQPDNNVQDLFNMQNYNRYGYVLNNPLKYTDQSGEFWNYVAGFLFSIYVHGGSASGELNPTKWNLNTWMSAFSATGSSLASSYVTGSSNSYIDNYNNKAALGASATSSGDDYIQLYNAKEGNEKASTYNHEAFAYATVATAGLVADDVTVIGVADDVLIPVAWGTAATVWTWDNREVIRDDAREIVDAIHRSLDPSDFHYVTYTKTSLDGRLVYVGRSSGYGTPEDIVKRRDLNHHIGKGNIKYGPAELSSSLPATVPGGYFSRFSDPSYWSIRGSEQIQIERWRKLEMSGNGMNGISPTNDKIGLYLEWGIKLLF